MTSPGNTHCPGEHPFDALASDYDEDFTRSLLGRMLRRAVWGRTDACFEPGQTLLDLGCGTGEDAIHLGRRGCSVLALDQSPDMVSVARDKVAREGLDALVSVTELPIEAVRQGPDAFRSPDTAPSPPFDGALSDFGALNCVSDLVGVAAGLHACLKPGATALFCVMGRVVPWEWAWYLARGRPRTAFRRLRTGGVVWRGARVTYPSPGRLARLLRPHFSVRRLAGLGVLLPPTYADRWVARHPRTAQFLNRCERAVETMLPLPYLADHYLLELERLPA